MQQRDGCTCLFCDTRRWFDELADRGGIAPWMKQIRDRMRSPDEPWELPSSRTRGRGFTASFVEFEEPDLPVPWHDVFRGDTAQTWEQMGILTMYHNPFIPTYYPPEPMRRGMLDPDGPVRTYRMIYTEPVVTDAVPDIALPIDLPRWMHPYPPEIEQLLRNATTPRF